MLHFTSLKVALEKGRKCRIRALRILIKAILSPSEQRIILFPFSDKVLIVHACLFARHKRKHFFFMYSRKLYVQKNKICSPWKECQQQQGCDFFPGKQVCVYFPMNKDGSWTLHCAHFHILYSQIIRPPSGRKMKQFNRDLYTHHNALLQSPFRRPLPSERLVS